MYPYIAIHKDDLDREDPVTIEFTSKNEGLLLSTNNDQEEEVGEEVVAWESDFIEVNFLIP